MLSQNHSNSFAHLHVHTEYSMLDGISRIPELVTQTASLGMSSLAMTDHGTLYGVVDFYSACKEAGVKPIIGCEVYVAKNSRLDRSSSERSPHHLVMLAKDNTGYRNLMQLVTKAHVEGFHYRPRIDRELIEQYREGLIVLSGCPSAEVPRHLADGDFEEAKRAASWYRDLFGDGYFLELQRHEHIPQLTEINQGLVQLSKEMDLPLVVTNDAHYVHQADSPLQDVYICIQTNTNLQDEKRLRMEDTSFYIKSAQEMAGLFPDFPDALSNTLRIADMCNVELNFDQTHLPRFPTPNDMDAEEYLTQLCWEGFKRRYPNPTPDAVQRLEYELEVIKYTKFANYFLVVWDIIDFVRRSGIMYGVRGSAAASVALYCLGITNVDPLEYRLVFERFLNLERKEMPDIDLDFQDDRRDEVLHYVIDRYGSDKVAQIITFGTMGAKAALRDVGRGLGMSYGDVDRIARMVPLKSRTLEDAMKANQEFSDAYQNEEPVKTLVDNAKGLEGIVHHVSTHAAGVLIADEPLTATVPLQRPSRGDENSPVMMTQYSMDPVAKLGLLKMDFLGLTNLTILDRAVKVLDETRGIKIDISRLPLDDPETFELLSSGKTTEVFQLESAGMQRYIKDLKPSNLNDIAAMIALYRPGPMEHIDTFINAKHGKSPITYPHPSLKELLDETYGVIVYQDQVLLILQSFAGYSLGEADTVRKAMGKKIASLMSQERDKFIEGAQTKGFGQNIAVQIFDLIEPFAGYAFNKAHSVSYALISYWTAYFKAHYPREYMASVLNSRLDHIDKVVNAINECFKLKISVLPPDVNRSGEFFVIDKDSGPQPSLRVGLAAVKTVGEGAVRPLVEERKANGPFLSIDDFCRRADVSALNRRTLESLAKAGAFDSLGPRGAVLAAVDQIMSAAQLESRIRNSGQTSMFDAMAGSGDGPALPGIDLSGTDATPEEKAAWERELIGVPLSYNPLLELANLEAGDAISSLDQLDEDMGGQSMTMLGHVSSITERYTKEQKKFLVVSLDLLGGPAEVIVWPDVLERTAERWAEGKVVRVSGKLRLRGDQYSLACEDVVEYSASAAAGQPSGRPAPEKKAETAAEKPASQPPAQTAAKPVGQPNGQAAPLSPPATAAPANGYNGSNRNGGAGHRNGGSQVKEGSNGRAPSETRTDTPEYDNGSARSIVLQIRESDDPIEDAHHLREVIQVLLEYPGKDRVHLEIYTNNRRVLMELPVVSAGYCPELAERLQDELLGPDSVSLEYLDDLQPENAPA
jgi:DNA polymerase-3 subunit alpha